MEKQKVYSNSEKPGSGHPDLSLVRKFRIARLHNGLARAEDEGNYGKKKYFEKEIQIQQAYLQMESA